MITFHTRKIPITKNNYAATRLAVNMYEDTSFESQSTAGLAVVRQLWTSGLQHPELIVTTCLGEDYQGIEGFQKGWNRH